MKAYLKNPEILYVHKGTQLYYGASQQFYHKYIRRLSGCGPTTASLQLAYLAATRDSLNKIYPYEAINYDNMLAFMNEIWNYVTPSIKGVDKPEILLKGLEKYTKEMNAPTETNMLIIEPRTEKDPIENTAKWIYNELSKDNPIAFLNLDNGQEKKLPRWHWVLIIRIDYSEKRLSAIIYDEGVKKQIDLGLWLTTTSLRGGFVSIG